MRSSGGFIFEQNQDVSVCIRQTVLDGAIIASIMLVAPCPQIISFPLEAYTVSSSRLVSTSITNPDMDCIKLEIATFKFRE